MLNVGLLGVFRVAGVDNRTWSELGPAGRGLASFLFTYPDRPHRRERLADLFWPDLDAERARRALNSAIWRLRKLLAMQPESAGSQNLITVGSDTILERTAWLDIDALALEQVGSAVLREPTMLDNMATLNRIAAILHRYEGPFLDGDDGDWILEERERLHSLFLRAATVVVRHLGIAELYDDAIRLARRALRFDPYREELARQLLILLALDERRCEALRFYEQWSATLKSELDITPLPATRKVIDEIRAMESPEAFGSLRAQIAGFRQ
jgi:DNA-binding SARP family transcriptional activator